VGTAAGGTTGLGNAANGVHIHAGASVETIGGSAPSLRNIISANGPGNCAGDGVEIDGGSQSSIRGNYIGMDIMGMAPLGNGGNGVSIFDLEGPASGNVVGGTGTGDRNTISANGTAPTCPGLALAEHAHGKRRAVSAGAARRRTRSPPTTWARPRAAWSRSFPGTTWTPSASTAARPGNVIGGTVGLTPGDCTGACNRIAHSNGAGVTIRDAQTVRNAIRANMIASNTGLGIDLGADGVTQNDPLDADFGPNQLQNFPVIKSAFFDGAATNISGSWIPLRTSLSRSSSSRTSRPIRRGSAKAGSSSGPRRPHPMRAGRASFSFAAAGPRTQLSTTATDYRREHVGVRQGLHQPRREP
jgi:hypothetical protein